MGPIWKDYWEGETLSKAKAVLAWRMTLMNELEAMDRAEELDEKTVEFVAEAIVDDGWSWFDTFRDQPRDRILDFVKAVYERK